MLLVKKVIMVLLSSRLTPLTIDSATPPARLVQDRDEVFQARERSRERSWACGSDLVPLLGIRSPPWM